ncbi:MAG: phosphoadenylyl-sulfate reductase [Sphingomonadaceae bacterium]|uniref:phosphoadenylyl-sulfate reductase n=1 Tax=Thermaurantiacus sp. TaxID=2820283 RepID=UPI00298F3951|nr:phosphoadenylyl-sulfate reductase [Thermaurantiacus sp.]MCS6987753.1 phosphoadenylyl-sulfate reductase [Sphingomonadaceae bacterium]MDW8415027.1 phosphoadenylyl-sulfate reductase [Thermaurantiacus sp.]
MARPAGDLEAEPFARQADRLSAEELIAWALAPERPLGRVAVVSSFGAESAVLLDMVAAVDRAAPVLFVNTLRLFPETLAYARELSRHLGLKDVRWLVPEQARLEERDPRALRWSYDPDGCCHVRKVEPLEAALTEFDCWISGRKRYQSATRAGLPKMERDAAGRLKLNPLADWTAEKLRAYAMRRGLPPHPLVAAGYLSIGCQPCTSRVRPGEDPRAGRWRGWDKTECGIHGPAHDPVF